MPHLEDLLEGLPFVRRVAFAAACAERALNEVRTVTADAFVIDDVLSEAVEKAWAFALSGRHEDLPRAAALHAFLRQRVVELPDATPHTILYATHAVERALLASLEAEQSVLAAATAGYDVQQIMSLVYLEAEAAERLEAMRQEMMVRCLTNLTSEDDIRVALVSLAEYKRGELAPRS